MSERLFREMSGYVAGAAETVDGRVGEMRALTQPDGDSAFANPDSLIVEGN